jgi:hypothetical protein
MSGIRAVVREPPPDRSFSSQERISSQRNSETDRAVKNSVKHIPVRHSGVEELFGKLNAGC